MQAPTSWQRLAVFSLLVLLILGAGFVSALANRIAVVATLGMLGGLVVLMTPLRTIYWLLMVMSFLLLGPVQYFFHISQVQWLPALLGMALYLQSLILLLGQGARAEEYRIPAFLFWIVVAASGAIFSSIVGGTNTVELIMASRNWILVWGALPVFVVGAIDAATIEKLWRLLLGVVVVQPPLALYQLKFVAARRRAEGIGGSSWDAVVGTFPGTDIGGSDSAAMGTFLLIMIVAAVALGSSRFLSRWKVIIIVVSAVVTIGMMEVKAVVLLIPVSLAMYFWRDLIRRPMQAILGLALSVAASALIFVGYQRLHYDQVNLPVRAELYGASVIDRVIIGLRTDQQPNAADRLSRGALLVQWWNENPGSGKIAKTVFGHGVGKTQNSNLGVGAVARSYGDVDRSTVMVLLWETGLLGLGLGIAMLLSAAWLSARLARDLTIPEVHRVLLRVGSIGLLLVLLTLPYKAFAIRTAPMQLFVILMLGQSYFWFNRKTSSQAVADIKLRSA